MIHDLLRSIKMEINIDSEYVINLRLVNYIVLLNDFEKDLQGIIGKLEMLEEI